VISLGKNTLSTEHEIKKVRRTGQKFSSEHLAFSWIEAQETKLAVSCSKRHLKRAVDRNYFKRINRVWAAKQDNVHLHIVALPEMASVPRKNYQQIIANSWHSYLKHSNTV